MFDKPFSKPRFAGFPTPPSVRSDPTALLLLATRYGRLSKEELESARRTARRRLKRRGRLLLRTAAYLPVTAKPAQVRMGSGKGRVAGWKAPVSPGKVLFELSGVPKAVGLEALMAASVKLSVSTTVRSLSELYS